MTESLSEVSCRFPRTPNISFTSIPSISMKTTGSVGPVASSVFSGSCLRLICSENTITPATKITSSIKKTRIAFFINPAMLP